VSYYTRVKTFLLGTLARGSDVRFEYDAIAASFDTVEAAILALQGEVSELQTGGETGWAASIDTRWALGTVAGTDTITAVAPGSPTATDTLTDSLFFFIEPANDNTGAVTLNIGTSEGAEPIQKLSAGVYTNLSGGDLQAGAKYLIIYDASEGAWMLHDPMTGTASDSESNIFNTNFLGNIL
jgi:hypothetical protein